MNIRLIIGIVVGATAALFIIVGLGAYALWQRKRAKKTVNQNNPFGNATPNFILMPDNSICNYKYHLNEFTVTETNP